MESTKMHSRLLSTLALLLINQLVTQCDGSASLTLRFITYNNPNSRDWYNQACDIIVNTACDNVFTFCLDIAGGNNNFGTADCLYGVQRTGEFRNWDSIRFQTDMFGVANPIVKKIDTWQNIKLKVEVRDDDSSHSSHDLVDRYLYTWEAVPGVNNTAGTPSTVVIRGKRTSTQKTSLTVEFSVKCDAHYYGPDCATYCKYTDDGSGHYRCTQSGQKECLPGTRCETDLDECISNPCHNNGTCVDEPGGFRCECPESHPASLSPLCAIHTCLHDDPCQNGGTCYGAGLCQCPPNYTGSKCDLHYCQAKCISCMNGGVCTGSACDCPLGTLGGRCEVRLCDVIDCVNGGTCMNGTCRCAPGYEGKYCHQNVDDCGSAPCANGGVCVDGVDSYLCQCGQGFTGVNCEVRIPTTTTTTTTTTTSPTKATTTEDRGPNFVNGKGSLTDKPGMQPVKKAIPTTQFMALIIILVVLVIVIIILVAILCRERVRRRSKENRSPRPTRDPNSNFENPVYTMERSATRQNPYEEGHYLQPTDGAIGGGDHGGSFVGKGESPYAHPPRGPARPVSHMGGEPLYDHPRPMTSDHHPYPPPYSAADGAGYSRSIDQGVVRMGDIKARVEEEGPYEELKAPKH